MAAAFREKALFSVRGWLNWESYARGIEVAASLPAFVSILGGRNSGYGCWPRTLLWDEHHEVFAQNSCV